MMEREKLSFYDVVDKWKLGYMSIIFLTLHFQDIIGGLRLLHYRYALVIKDANDSIK